MINPGSPGHPGSVAPIPYLGKLLAFGANNIEKKLNIEQFKQNAQEINLDLQNENTINWKLLFKIEHFECVILSWYWGKIIKGDLRWSYDIMNAFQIEFL